MQTFVSSPNHITSAQPCSFKDRVKQQLFEWRNALVEYLIPTEDAVQICQKERSGVTTWLVYDRITEERQQLASEAAVHAWLEQRYR